jgi:DNA repair protein RadC
MRITELPLHDRPRERLLRLGAAALSDAELLAVLLHTGRQGRSALDIAALLLTRYGGLARLYAADSCDVQETAGIGPAKYAQLCAGAELARRALGENWQRRQVLADPRASDDYLRALLSHRTSEVFACVFLDARLRVIGCEELFRGTIDGTSVHAREVVRRALAHNAASVILAHNHPSGVAEPSNNDVALTRRLREALALIDVRVLDHVVVGQGDTVSLAARGLC